MAASSAEAKPTDEALTALGHRIVGQFQGYENFEVRNVAAKANTADRLFLNDFLSDVTIVAEGTRFPAHRIVLYSQSSFFRAALSVDMKEKLEGVIELPETSEVAKAILSFLYTTSYAEDGTSPMEHSVGVYVAAAKYDIPALKALATSNLASLFSSLESRINPDIEACLKLTPEDLICIEKFLEVVVLVYDNTEDTDALRSEIVSTARELLRIQDTALVDAAWVRCFQLAPAFGLDLVKPISVNPESDYPAMISNSRRWRGARDCMILECGNCNTAITMSMSVWQRNEDEVAKGSECPNHAICEGKLDFEIPNY